MYAHVAICGGKVSLFADYSKHKLSSEFCYNVFIHDVIQYFKSDIHQGTCPTVSVLTRMCAGVALTAATMYNGPEDSCLLLYILLICLPVSL